MIPVIALILLGVGCGIAIGLFAGHRITSRTNAKIARIAVDRVQQEVRSRSFFDRVVEGM